MFTTVLYMSISLDGFVAGPNEGLDNGLGDGGHRLPRDRHRPRTHPRRSPMRAARRAFLLAPRNRSASRSSRAHETRGILHLLVLQGGLHKGCRCRALALLGPRFDVMPAPEGPAVLLTIKEDLEEASRWSLRKLSADSGYVAALAVEGHCGRLKCWQVY
jgi:hypothetical protein